MPLEQMEGQDVSKWSTASTLHTSRFTLHTQATVNQDEVAAQGEEGPCKRVRREKLLAESKCELMARIWGAVGLPSTLCPLPRQSEAKRQSFGAGEVRKPEQFTTFYRPR